MTDTRLSPGSASAREKVAAFLLARDENYAATPHMLAWAEKLIRDCKDAEHDGDCTNKSHTCHRCTADQALDDADKIIALTPIGVAQCSQEPVAYQFRQRSGVGKGPQSQAPWGDWCSIERTDYELHLREPNNLIEVRALYASPPSPVAGEAAYRETVRRIAAIREKRLAELRDCLQSIADMPADEPREPDDADWRFRCLSAIEAAKNTLAASLQKTQTSPGWTPDQFWEYAERLLGSEWLRDQMRDMMACKGLVLSSIATPAETTRNLAESICDDCPPAGSIEGTRCVVCPRASSVSSTEGK